MPIVVGISSSQAAVVKALEDAMRAAGLRVNAPPEPGDCEKRWLGDVLVVDTSGDEGRVLAGWLLQTVPVVALVSANGLSAVSGADAAAVVLNSDPVDLVVHAVKVVAHGYAVLPLKTTRAFRATTGCRPDLLTPDQLFMLREIANGSTMEALAEHMSISPRTAYRQLGKLITRLGAKDRTAAVVKASRLGLIDDPQVW